MPASPRHPEIPLPKGWPRRVRSAIIYCVSLAQASLTCTRSWAANSCNARIRLNAENDRLRQELALLREESRIKDSRMARIPAQRRPHYPPVERLAILELRAARNWSLSQTAERLLVTPATVASWMTRLDGVYFGRRAACRAPRFEPRRHWPRRSPCASPHAPIRGRPGARIELQVSYRAKRKHLPVVELRRAA